METIMAVTAVGLRVLFAARDKLFLKNISDFVLFSAAAPPGGGRAGKKMLAYFGRYYFSF